MGRSTQGDVPDLSRIAIELGETSLAEVLGTIGPPDEWYRIGHDTLLLYRHRRHHFGRYGIDFSAVSYLAPQNIALVVVADNFRFTYDRIQQAEARLAIIVDRRGKVTAYSQHDGRGRLTFF